MNKIDKDFVYNRFPKTEHDIKLYEDYKAFISLKCKTEAKNDLEELLSLFPVYEGTENANDVFVLTRFGFMALSIDDDFMNTCYKPWCSLLLQQDIASEIQDRNKIRLLRASLIEFALLGCLEAHQLMNRLDSQIGPDDLFMESIVNERCPNLRRFLNAHDGAGRGVNEGDEVSSYAQALQEVKSGCKRTHWIWYIFPQQKGLGHSYNSEYYGLDGIDEARAYLAHPVLGARLREISEALLIHEGKKDIDSIMGSNIDVLKLQTCMNLFNQVSPNDIFEKVLDAFFPL